MSREQKPRKSKLVVHKKIEFIETLCPKTKGFNGKFGDACQEAAKDILTKIRKVKGVSNYNSKFSTRCGDNIYRLLFAPRSSENQQPKNTEFTIEVLNALLCWFFIKKHSDDEFYEKHTIENLEKFFSLIAKKTNRKESERKKFNTFIADINSIKDELASPFNQYDYEMDRDWNFSIIKCSQNEEKFYDKKKVEPIIGADKSRREVIENIKDKGLEEKTKESNSKSIQNIFNKRKYLFTVLVGVFSICSLLYYFFSNKNKPETLKISEQSFCKSIEQPSYPRIIIFPFKEDELSKNKGYAIKLYNKISEINKRDSLGIEVIYCDVFKEYLNQEEAFSSEKYQKYLKSYQKRDIKLFVLYEPNGEIKSAKEAETFKNFRKYAMKGGLLVVSPEFYEDRLVFNSFFQIVRALKEKKTNNHKSLRKAIDYINTILIQDKITKDDIRLLEFRSKLKNYLSDKDGQIADLNHIHSLDSTNIFAISKLAHHNFINKDSSAIKLYFDYLELQPTHCNVRIGLAKSLVLFRKDFLSAKNILDGKYKNYEQGCDYDKYYWETKGGILILEGRYKEAIKILLDGLVKQPSRQSYISYLLAQAYLLNNEYKESIKILQGLKKPGQVYFLVDKYLAIIYKNIGKSDLAIKTLELDRSYTSNRFLMLSHLYLEKGLAQNALELLNDGIARASFNSSTMPYLLNYRRIANNRLKNKRLSVLDSLKILEYEGAFFKVNKDKGIINDFKFNIIHGMMRAKIKDIPLIQK